MAMNEDLFRQHIVPDLQSLNRWLIVLLCALINKQGGSLKLTSKEIESVDKGWTVDYRYDDESREATLSVRVGPYTETYVVGERGRGGAIPRSDRLDAIRESPRSAIPDDERLAKLEREQRQRQKLHDMEKGEWIENPQSNP